MKRTVNVEICHRADNGQICTRQYTEKRPKTIVIEHRKKTVK